MLKVKPKVLDWQATAALSWTNAFALSDRPFRYEPRLNPSPMETRPARCALAGTEWNSARASTTAPVRRRTGLVIRRRAGKGVSGRTRGRMLRLPLRQRSGRSGPGDPDRPLHSQRPVNSAGRFSRNADTPSRLSSLPKQVTNSSVS